MNRYLVSITCAALFIACADLNDANEDNFKVAVNNYFESRPVCADISGSFFSNNSIPGYFFDFPTVIPAVSPYANGQKTRERARELFSVLAEFELLTATTGEFEWEDGFGKFRKLEGTKFELSDNGLALFQRDKLCYGKKAVTNILNFTAPTEASGNSNVFVKYAYQVEVNEDWIKHPHFESTYKDIELSGEDNVVLVLTQKGWVHPSELM